MPNIFKRYVNTIENSISKRLLRTVLSIYLSLTLLVTSVHIGLEYYNAKESVQSMLSASEGTFHDILATDLWNYNYDQLKITADSMMGLPFIRGIEITSPDEDKPIVFNVKGKQEIASNKNMFWHEFDLNYRDAKTIHRIGNVRVYSESSVVIAQIEAGIYTLIINAIIKTMALIILVTVVFNRLLTRPLEQLAHHAESIDANSPTFKPIDIADNPKDELGLLQSAMNRMMKKTIDTIQALDTVNKSLEQRVAVRTQKLRETVTQLDKEQLALKSEVESRTKSEQALSVSLEKLKLAQVQLVASEKMASLGMLAAGVAHEINSPIYFVLQNVNVLGEYNEAFHHLIKDYKLYVESVIDEQEEHNEKAQEILTRIRQYEEEEDLDFIISDSLSLLKSTEDGIGRVIDIVKNMKTFSHPDVESVHSVDVHEVIDSTLLLLKSEINSKVNIVKKLSASSVRISCNRNQLGQIFLNLIMNAVHAMAGAKNGTIHIRTDNDDTHISISIIDNGCGIPEDKIKMIFDPFYTTKDVGEGTGMGLSISYGIVQEHHGTINVSSIVGKGTKFTLQFPLEFPG